MSPDRVIYSFVLGWVVLIAVLIALDWLGNPNRGMFRPKGDHAPRDRSTRKAERTRQRLEEDASVRATLRDAYGASSLRLNWNGEHEREVRQIDDALVVDDQSGAVDVRSREIETIGDPLPNVTEEPPEPDVPEPDVPEPDVPEPDAEPPTARKGWKVGADPLSLTAKGNKPAPATVRSRVWKNHGESDGWTDENRKLLASGKAPRRHNPITGLQERAVVDIETGRASWGREAVDPFGPEA